MTSVRRGGIKMTGPESTVLEPGQAPAVKIAEVWQRFTRRGADSFNAIEEVSLEIPDGEFWSIVGPSGCGKSTLLNMISGSVQPTSGDIIVNGHPVTAINKTVGYVSQDSNLLPWLTTWQNIELPLILRHFSKEERRARTADWIRKVGLDGFEKSYPHQLSGGMQKRCSIARTLVYDPEVLLLDEPFGALDAITRSLLQVVLLDLWSSTRKTVAFVTHDLSEAIALSDKVVVMTRRPGRIKAVVDVTLPRPRDVLEIASTAGFSDLHAELWALFQGEI